MYEIYDWGAKTAQTALKMGHRAGSVDGRVTGLGLYPIRYVDELCAVWSKISFSNLDN